MNYPLVFHKSPYGTTKFLKSHAISEAAAQALKENDYEKFLLERRKTLIELEKAFIKPLRLDYDSES